MTSSCRSPVSATGMTRRWCARDSARAVFPSGISRPARWLPVDALNDAKAYVTGKKLLDLGLTPDRARLEDPQTDLKTLLP